MILSFRSLMCFLLQMRASASPNKADGDEFRVNRRRVATGLVCFADASAWIHSRFIGAGYLRNLSTEGELDVEGQGWDT
jgi:hypothetical protein